MAIFEFTGYAGKVIGSNFNISNLPSDWVTITIEPIAGGDVNLTVNDNNTLITITDSDGVTLVSSTDLSLIQFGTTGEMDDFGIYEYTILTVDGVDYMFLDNLPNPLEQPVNPFSGGNTNPLFSANDTDDHYICFALGTLIKVKDGEKLIEELRVGDAVPTRDSGLQTIRWIGSRKMFGAFAERHKPICINAGALGNGLPKRDLLVSPQHRVLLTDWRAELLFGTSEVLIPAKHLVNDGDIRVAADIEEFEYFHIMFDTHQTIFSEGLPTESFHPGDMAMKSLSEASRTEVLELFPELADDVASYGPATHTSLKAYEARALQSI